MHSKKFIVLGIIGVLLTVGIYIVLMGFPLKSFTAFGHTHNVLLARLSNEGDMTFGLYAGQWIIILSYIATFMMLFFKKTKAYIAQCSSWLGVIVLALSLPSPSDGTNIESSMGFGFWIILIVSIAWAGYLYYASKPKTA